MRHLEHTVVHTEQQLQHISATALHYNFELEENKINRSRICSKYDKYLYIFIPAWTLILIATAVNV